MGVLKVDETAPSPEGAAPSAGVEESIFLEAAQQLQESVRLGRSFETAQVKVIGLDDIRRAAGETWTQAGPRIRANSMQFLTGCLGEDDIVIPAGDGFLVIFAAGEGRDFAAESATIHQALNAFYLGEDATRALRAKVTHERVSPHGMVHLLGGGHAAAAAPVATTDKHEFAFLPVWDVLKEAITGYWIAPIYQEENLRPYGYDTSWAETRVHSSAEYLALDLAIVRRVKEEAERCLAGGHRCLINYSVHATTMQSRQRRQIYLNHLYALPERLRPYLVGRIAEIEPGTPLVTIAEWVHLLRPVSVRVTIQLHESDRALTGLDATGAFSASFILSALQHTGEGREAYKRHIQRWASALRPQRIRLRIDNVIDREMLTWALACGVDTLTGTRYWSAERSPSGVKIYTRAQLAATLKTL